MPRLKESEVAEREGWVLEKFRSDPRISAPKMNKLLKERYKNTMRAKRIYELRDAVLDELGWKKDAGGTPQPPKEKKNGKGKGKGKHVQPETNVPALSQANRIDEEPASPFSSWLVPAEGIEDAVSFQRKLNALRDKGATTLKVDSFTERYVVVSA
jgi:hypothetical protein